MSIKTDETGRRWIAVETEVPGTPEQVWDAIATGPGVSSWFVPMEADGDTITMHFGPGMDSVAKRTSWDPPRRFSAESSGLGPDAPPMATEWTVEAKAGGTCIVRVMHSLFASTDDWDNQLESIESGWPAIFRILAAYLRDFRGQRCSYFNVMSIVPGTEAAVWESLSKLPLAGTVEDSREGVHAFKLLRVKDPAPGLAFVNTCSMGPQVMASISFYLYGDQGVAGAASEEPRLKAWMDQQFTPAG